MGENKKKLKQYQVFRGEKNHNSRKIFINIVVSGKAQWGS